MGAVKGSIAGMTLPELKALVSEPRTSHVDRLNALGRIEVKCRDHGAWLLTFSRASGVDPVVSQAAYKAGQRRAIVFTVRVGVDAVRTTKREAKAWLRRKL
jgi:hypothetical protein